MSPIRQAKSKQTESAQDKKGNKASRATPRAPGGVKESFGVWDAAEHLRSEEEMIAYLEACMEEGDPELTVRRSATLHGHGT